MGSFNFKSVGKTQLQRATTELEVTPLPIGIKTPITIGTDSLFEMHTSMADQVHDNLRNLILTNWGERLGLYYFGANLRPITTELVSLDDFDAAAVSRISDAVSRWMSYVSLEEFLSEVDRTENTNTAVVRLTITYSIPMLNVTKRTLQVTLYAI